MRLFNKKYEKYCFLLSTSCSNLLHAIWFPTKYILIYFKIDKYQYKNHVYQYHWHSDSIQSTMLALPIQKTSRMKCPLSNYEKKKIRILTDNQMLRWALENVCKSRGMSTLLNDFFHFSIPSWSEIQKLAHQITIANCANRSMLSVLPVLLFCFPKNWFDEI